MVLDEKTAAPYLPWFPKDFLASTRGWTHATKSIYRELLEIQWDIGALDKDPKRLQRVVAATDSEWSEAWPDIEPKLPVGSDGKRRNPRLDMLRRQTFAGIQARKQQAQAAGKASANKRLVNGSSTTSPLRVNHSDSDSESDSESDTESEADARASRSLKITSIKPLSNLSVVGSKNGHEQQPARAARSPTATRLPADFTMTLELATYAQDQGLQPSKVFERFVDYWKSASGQKARKHDWNATWRNWCRSEADRPQAKTKTQPKRAPTTAELEARENAKH